MRKSELDYQDLIEEIKKELIEKKYIKCLNALIFAEEKHRGQYRHPKEVKIPYITHPLMMVKHALSLSIYDEDILTSLLLHDVVEDCNVQVSSLPANENVKEIVKLVTKTKDKSKNEYYDQITKNINACLVKCIDRCHNVSCMADAFSTEKLYKYIDETETYFPRLLNILKQDQKYKNISWILEYQINSLISSSKRIISSERINQII